VTECVIDASIVVKWVINEAGTSQALKLRRHSAPDLLVGECADIVWKKLRRGELTAAEASLAIDLLASAEIELIPMRSVAGRAVDLSILLDRSVCDCMYLALAEKAKRPFVTADAYLLLKFATARTVARLITAIDLAVLDGLGDLPPSKPRAAGRTRPPRCDGPACARCLPPPGKSPRATRRYSPVAPRSPACPAPASPA
jgi:predicted nucleic acid-binding protein